jgi:Fe2+ or Zn2+ uptake regulation protein
MQEQSALLRATLARHGIRATRQREEIYAALAATHAHPTAEELHRSVRGSQPGISLATVYNTLETFTRAGMCRKLSTAAAGGPCRYDADLSDHLHVITTDGQVRDIPEDLGEAVLRHIPDELVRAIEERMGVRVERMTVDFLIAPARQGAGTTEQ